MKYLRTSFMMDTLPMKNDSVINRDKSGQGLKSYQKKFLQALEQSGQSATKQRLLVAAALYGMSGHPTVVELYEKLRKTLPNIGLATVYRTVKVLKDVGLALELQGDENGSRFEAVSAPEHHDHFICRKCGKVMEIEAPALGKLQLELAREYGFYPEAGAHCVYGLCGNCLAT